LAASFARAFGRHAAARRSCGRWAETSVLLMDEPFGGSTVYPRGDERLVEEIWLDTKTPSSSSPLDRGSDLLSDRVVVLSAGGRVAKEYACVRARVAGDHGDKEVFDLTTGSRWTLSRAHAAKGGGAPSAEIVRIRP